MAFHLPVGGFNKQGQEEGVNNGVGNVLVRRETISLWLYFLLKGKMTPRKQPAGDFVLMDFFIRGDFVFIGFIFYRHEGDVFHGMLKANGGFRTCILSSKMLHSQENLNRHSSVTEVLLVTGMQKPKISPVYFKWRFLNSNTAHESIYTKAYGLWSFMKHIQNCRKSFFFFMQHLRFSD